MENMKCLRTCVCLGVLFLQTVLIGAQSSVNVNNDGQLTFTDIPEGAPYSTPGSFDEGSFPLPTTWDFIGNFLQTVSPGSPPYDLINGVLADASTVNLDLLTGNITRYQNNLLGFAVAFVIGLLFVLIFPIVALCVCCCRCCCNNCGGKLHQDVANNSCTRATVYGICLLVCIIFVFSGAVTALCISVYTGQTVQKLPETVNNNFNDIVAYADNTVNEINFVMGDQLNWTLVQVKNDLNDIGTLVGVPVRDALSANVTPAIDAVINMESTINSTLFQLTDIEAQQGEMETLWDDVSSNLTSILADLNYICMSCSCCTAATANLRNLQIEADYRDIDVGTLTGTFPQPAVTLSKDQLQSLVDNDLSAQARQGAQTFEDIPETLTSTTSSEITNIINTIDQLQQTLGDQISTTLSSLTDLTDTVTPFQEQADGFLRDYANNYDQYRAIVMYVFYGFILFIVVLFLLGLLVGGCGYDRNVLPTDRCGTSNCGALLLMAGSGFVFIFGAFFMIITSLTFILGGPIDRLVCDPIVSGDLFAETVDKQGAIIPDGYYLGNLVFKDPSVDLTVTGLLNECENNQGIYTALRLENLLDINNFTDIESQLPDINSQFGNLTGDFTNIQILTADTKKTLQNFSTSKADEILWTNFTNELGKRFLYDGDGNNDTLIFLRDAVNTDAGAATGAAATNLSNIASDLTNLEVSVAALLTDVAEIGVKIDDFTSLTGQIDSLVNTTIEAAEAAQNYIDNNVEQQVQDVVVGYTDRILNYPGQFVNYTVNQLKYNIGGCRPVFNLWNEATNTVCIGFLRSFNGLWFTLGWCTVFLIPTLIFGIKLAKYFRRMDTCDEQYDGGYEMQSHTKGNKVAPGYDA